MSRNTEGPIFRRAVANPLPSPVLGEAEPNQNDVILSEDEHNQNGVVLSGARSAQSKDPRISSGPALLRVSAILAIALLVTTAAHAQGCAQCLDSTRATPPAVRAAYRHAIEILGGAGVTIFVAGLILLRREP